MSSEEGELLQTLIRNACINDGSAPADEIRSADVLCNLLEDSGFAVETFDAAPGRRSVVGRMAGTVADAPSLMLLGHTDVVPAIAERWSRDPFAAELVDGVIWGRGAMDMLGHVATMTLAARDYARTGRHQGGDIVLAMVADEEALGGFGMGYLVEHHPDAVDAQWVVTETGGSMSGTPQERRLSVMAAEKGAWRVRINVAGTPGHTSLPYGSVNALVIASEVVARIARFTTQIEICDPWRAFVEGGWTPQTRDALLNPEHVDFMVSMLPDFPARIAHAMSRMTLVPTSITTDASWNTIPPRASIELDVRTLPGQEAAHVRAVLTEAIGDLAESVAIEIVTGMPANASPAGTEFWSLMQDAAVLQVGPTALLPTMASGVTDARFLRAHGATAYGFGLYSERIPVSEIPRMLHGDDERVDLESLAMMRRLWSDMLGIYSERTASGR